MNTYKSAKGLKGILIGGLSGGEMVFRVYDEVDKEKFTDYKINIHDLSVTIDDDDAFIYEDREVIDYSKETLGNFGWNGSADV